jgi:hypothetical protein
MAMLRLGVVFAVLSAIVAGGVAAAKRPGLTRFSGSGISFSYPSQWQAQYANSVFSKAGGVIVYLSTERLQPPCLNFTQCEPLNTLPPKGVLVSWTYIGVPWYGLANAPGTRTRIGGLPARIIVNGRGVGSTCMFVGATGSVIAYISAGETGWMEMDACMRGPNFPRFEKQVRAMLQSVSFRPPRPARSHP